MYRERCDAVRDAGYEGFALGRVAELEETSPGSVEEAVAVRRGGSTHSNRENHRCES
jgi:hypothetical protein